MAAFACLAFAAGASAADKYFYDTTFETLAYDNSAGGTVKVSGLDPGQNVAFRILRGAAQQLAVSFGSGQSSQTFFWVGLAPGDKVEVQQPAGSVKETYTIPNVTVGGSAGSAVVNGNAPDGSIAVAHYSGSCYGWDSDLFPATVQGGSYSINVAKALAPGSLLAVTAYPGKGDEINILDRVPGETVCIEASSFLQPNDPGEPPSPQPYSLRASGFRPAVATGARIVLRRGATALVDYTVAGATSSIIKQTGELPKAGDVVEVYRPHTAPAPAATFTIPALSSKYDVSNGLVAVDGPAASFLQTFVGSQFLQSSMSRGATNTPDGRTLFNFSVPQGAEPAMDLANASYMSHSWFSPSGTREFVFGSAPGDLAPPILKLKLASKFKIAKLGSSLPVTITSSEAVATTIQLTLPAKLKTSAAKKPKKPTVIATSTARLKAGTQKVKIKLTKSGKKLLKKIRAQHLPAQTATLTVTATDLSGNAATKVKTTKLVPR